MGQALLLHNQVIRQAAYENAGHVLALEGDAFIVGFCEPLDAAIFAVQVQHALMQLDIPPELCYEGGDAATMPPRHSSSGNGRLGSYLTNGHTQKQQPLPLQCSPVSQLPVARVRSASPVLQQADWQQAGAGDATVINLPVSHSSCSPRHTAQATGASISRSRSTSSPGGTRQGSHSRLGALLCPWGEDVPASANGRPSSPGGLLLRSSDAGSNGLEASQSSSGRRPSSLARWLSGAGLFRGQGQPERPALFKGLRVRVGVATGPIRRGEAVDTTVAYSMARVISECGAGGQVLLDAATFLAIRPELQLLGAVGPTGLDYERPETGRH